MASNKMAIVAGMAIVAIVLQTVRDTSVMEHQRPPLPKGMGAGAGLPPRVGNTSPQAPTGGRGQPQQVKVVPVPIPIPVRVGAAPPPAAGAGAKPPAKPSGFTRGEQLGLGIGVVGLLGSVVIGALGFVLKPTYMKDPEGTPVDENGNPVPWSELPFGDKILTWLQENALLFSMALWFCVLCCCCCCCLSIVFMVMGSSSGSNNL